jgi:hypothetical protein
MSQVATVPPTSLGRSPDDDRFRHGWRDVPITLPDGREELDLVPLPLEDVVHPQEGDVTPENSQQGPDRRDLHNVYENRYAAAPHVLTQ